jgi:AbrB family looped-hinge helix DNA binding protein
MHIVIASNRGQIVIPKEVRKKLQIRPGKRLLLKTEGNHIFLSPLPDNPVEYFCGIFKEGSSLTKALIQDRRKEEERESKKAAR